MENLQEITGLSFWLLLIIVGFIQNMVFTAVSRSRQSANLQLHFMWALVSNAVWFFCNYFLLFPVILRTIMEGDLVTKILVGVIYGITTAAGSVTMMEIMLKKLKGKSKVGAKKYKLDQTDVFAIDQLTHEKFLRSGIIEALNASNGEYEGTLRYLLGHGR